jgi:hypothetical protein
MAAVNFENESAMCVSLLRKRSRSRPSVIDSPAIFLSYGREVPVRKPNDSRGREVALISSFLQVNHDRPRAEMLCRIAHNPPETSRTPVRLVELSLLTLKRK